MPNTSYKAELTEFLIYCGYQNILDPHLATLTEDEVLQFLSCLDNTRYSVQRKINVGVHTKPSWWQIALLNPECNPDYFKSQFRMNQKSFWSLCSLITGHTVFTNIKEPVHLQLGVALYRFGTYGNASSLQHIATKFGIGKGSTQLYIERVMTALNAFSSHFIQWPSSEERKAIGDTMAANLLPKCVGFVDGSDAPFHCAPKSNKETYWSRKKKYCMQFQIVCDPDKRIRDLFVGFPGSVHDSKVYRSSPLGIAPDKHFTNGEYLIGDSAYGLSETVIVPFRRSIQGLSRDQKLFNYHLSSHRVKVEHTIGMLKGRFMSLKGMRILVSDKQGHERACKWIHVCSVLHNFLLHNDPWNEIENDDQLDNENEVNDNNGNTPSGYNKRQALLDIFTMMNE